GSVMLGAGCEALDLHLSAAPDFDLSADGGGDLAIPPDLLPHPVAVIQATPDLVGFLTKLDGTGSTDPLSRTLTYSWRFVAVPSGSTLDGSAFKPSASADKP